MLVDLTPPTLQVVRVVSSNPGKSSIADIEPSVDLPIANTGEPFTATTNTATAGDTVALTIQASEFIYEPVVTFSSGGVAVAGSISYVNTNCGSQTIDDSGIVAAANNGTDIVSELTFADNDMGQPMPEIGRASCRERV